MLKKTKINLIITAILTIILGVIMIVNPLGATETLCRIAGVIIIIAGALTTLSYFFLQGTEIGGAALVTGIVELGFGIWLTAQPRTFITILGIILGGFIMMHATNTLQNAIETKRLGYKYWWTMLILAPITAGLGIVLIFSPFGTAGVAMAAAGICLVIDGIMNLFVTFKAMKAVKAYRENSGYIETTGHEKH